LSSGSSGALRNVRPARGRRAALRLLRGRLLRAAPASAPTASSPPPRHLLSYPGSAYLKVAEGCGNRCSYCAIPLIRGPLASRPREEVVREAAELLARGVRELVLIAQDLASYGTERSGGPSELPALLRELLRLPGEFWLRCLYIHPDHFPGQLLELAADDAAATTARR